MNGGKVSGIALRHDLMVFPNHLGLDVNQVYATAHDRINQARAQQAQAVAVGSDAGRESPESPGVRPGA
jgi:hypothetical protein